MRLCHAVIALAFFATPSTHVAGQDKPAPAKGETVTELDKAIFYVFQAKNNDYWFGSNERGVYRYDGKTLVNFTTKDGLAYNCIRGIQEDKSGNLYFTTSAWDGGRIYTHAISRFDGKTFRTLAVTESPSPETAWKLQPDDLWFADAQDRGGAYRYDGKALHRLVFPKTKAGDELIAQMPRSQYPNIKHSPYDVYIIFKDSKGSVWFGTGGLGVCRYDGKSFTWIGEDEVRNGSFGTRSVIEDKDGKFWFSNVVNRYAVDLSDPARPGYKKEKGLRDAKDKVPFGGVMSSVVDKTGALWMATLGEGVWRYDGKDLTHYPVKVDGKGITLFTITQDNQGVFWLGTHKHGAFKFNGKAFEKFKP